MNDEQQREQEEQQLSPRRRTALVSYLAVLFAAAFLFVAIMMVAETKRLKTMNQELQHDSQKNAATLTNNINALQQENEQLSKNNQALNDKIEALEAAARSEAAEKSELNDKLEAALDAQEKLRQQLDAAEDAAELAEKKTADAVQVSEWLHQAMAADEDGDLDGLKELLAQIEPLEELLSDTEREIYEELKIA